MEYPIAMSAGRPSPGFITIRYWLNRDPIGLSGGTNLYAYVENNPISRVDPLGLWQITISGGYIFGGSFTFGNNGGSGLFNGQWNLGAYVGIGEGLSFNVDPNNSGCRDTGSTDPSLRIEGQIGLGPNVEGKLDIRSISDLSRSDAELAFSPSGTGVSATVIEQKDGQIGVSEKLPSWGFGESAYAGLGETKYGERPSKCSCDGGK